MDEITADYTTTYDRVIPPKEIVEYVSRKMKRGYSEIIRTNSKRDVGWTRDVAIWLVRQLTDLSLKDIGFFFGGRSGPTMSCSIDKVKEKRSSSLQVRAEIDQMKREIKEQRP